MAEAMQPGLRQATGVSSSARRLRMVTLGLGGLWALSWLLTATSLDRDIVIVPFYVDAAPSPEGYPQVRAFPSWTRAAVQSGLPLALGDAIVAIGGHPMRGAGTLRVVSHAWAAMGNDGVLEVEVLRAGRPLLARVAIPASIPKWPVVVVSGVFGAFALFALSRLQHLRLAQLAALPTMATALWLGAYFGRTAPEMLAGFWLRAGALALLLPANLIFFRHFPDADDSRVAWARGWPAILAVQGLFFVDTEMFHRFPALLSDLGPKLLTGVATALTLAVGTLNYRSSSPSGRRRFKWLLLGLYVALLPPTLVSLLSAIRPELGAYFLPSQLSLLAIPISIGIGLGRPELLDIDRLLDATTVYLGFAALLLVALTLGVPIWSRWASREAEISAQTATTLFTAGLLALALPAAVALRVRLDAWVLADRRALEGEVVALQLAIGADDKLEELATRLADRLPAIWKATGAELYADAGEIFAPVAASPGYHADGALPGSGALVRGLMLAEGPVSPDTWREPENGWTDSERRLLGGRTALLVPIRVVAAGQSRLVAFLALGPRVSGQPYEELDRSHLAAIAARAGAALTAREHGELLREARALATARGRERDEVRRISREKTTLLAAASHDLRQPLHALGLFLGALEDRVVDDEARTLLGDASQSARSLQQMFTSLLDVSQIDAGVLEPRPVDGVAVGALLAEIERGLGPLARRDGLRLRVRPTGLHGRTDPVLMRSVLQNLVGNALRYTAQGGVLLGARRRGETVRIEVWDTGQGIPQEQQRQIFEEWGRGSDAEAGEGFGLGLTIAQRLCSLLGHTLELRSWLGRGSVFAVTLPLSVPALRTAPLSAGELHDFRGHTVWVLDPDRAGRQACGALLRSWDLAVVEIETAEQAFALADRQQPDVLFVDCGGPEGSHRPAWLDELARRWSDPVPTCLLRRRSASPRYPEPGPRIPVLDKPVEPVRLRAVLAHLLRSGR